MTLEQAIQLLNKVQQKEQLTQAETILLKEAIKVVIRKSAIR